MPWASGIVSQQQKVTQAMPGQHQKHISTEKGQVKVTVTSPVLARSPFSLPAVRASGKVNLTLEIT